MGSCRKDELIRRLLCKHPFCHCEQREAISKPLIIKEIATHGAHAPRNDRGS